MNDGLNGPRRRSSIPIPHLLNPLEPASKPSTPLISPPATPNLAHQVAHKRPYSPARSYARVNYQPPSSPPPRPLLSSPRGPLLPPPPPGSGRLQAASWEHGGGGGGGGGSLPPRDAYPPPPPSVASSISPASTPAPPGPIAGSPYPPWPYAHPHAHPPPPPPSHYYPYAAHYPDAAHAHAHGGWPGYPIYPHPHPHYSHIAPPPPQGYAPGYAEDGSRAPSEGGNSEGGRRMYAGAGTGFGVPPPHPPPPPPPHLDPRQPSSHAPLYAYYPPPVYYPPHPAYAHPPPPPPHHVMQQQQQSQQASASAAATTANGGARKRTLQDGRDGPEGGAPVKKRARRGRSGSSATTRDATPAPRRRSTQNKHRHDGRTAAHDPDGLPPAPPPSSCTDGADGEDGPLHPELQLARCMSNRYKAEAFPRCVACTRRWAGDTCRFQNIRFFRRRGGPAGAIVGASFVENQRADGPHMRFPARWNRALDARALGVVKRTVARALLPALKRELGHLAKQGVICRPRDSDVRATCDTCMTSIFSESWLCRLCGREACAACYQTVHALTKPREGAADAELAAQQARREAHAHANPFFLSCTRRSEHGADDFSPTSRFHRPELEDVVAAMETLLSREEEEEESEGEGKVAEVDDHSLSEKRPAGGSLVGPAQAPSLDGTMVGSPVSPSDQQISLGGDDAPAEKPAVKDDNAQRLTAEMMSTGVANGPAWAPSGLCGDTRKGSARSSPDSTSDTLVTAVSSPPSASLDDENTTITVAMEAMTTTMVVVQEMDEDGMPSHSTQTFTPDALEDDALGALLRDGQPAVVTGLARHFAAFTPTWFTQQHGAAPCSVVDTQGESAHKTTLQEFFTAFAPTPSARHQPPQPHSPAKLKDWPPPGSFRSTVSELWDVLQRELPFGSFCRRDGARNLASHFPTNMPAPELGPRLDCATAAGSRGSVRLHVDAADSATAMLYAGEVAKDGGVGYAEWHLFRAEDAPKIRKFLRGRLDGDMAAMHGGASVGANAAAHDPVLAGAVYLDHNMRMELFREHGVHSHRVLQRAGDVVFVPAGVPHQIANAADCIKVSVDFVSAENVARCERLVGEFRAQNQSMAWREDQLQLQTMMWFAWLSCTRQEEEARLK